MIYSNGANLSKIEILQHKTDKLHENEFVLLFV